MGKFNVSTVQPGQVDEATKAVIETPTQQVQERTPQASAFEALLQGTPEVDTEAAAQDIISTAEQEAISPEIAEQQERERVPTLGERFQKAATESPKWQTKQVSDGPNGIENIRARSKNMVDLVREKELTGGWGIGSARKTAEGRSISDIYKTEGQEAGRQALGIDYANSPAAIFQKIGAAEVVPGTSQVTVNPNFVATLSAVTENFMMGAQVASEAGAPKEKVDEFTGEPTGELVRPVEDYQVSKAQGNTRLGQDIHREYQRIKNESEGRPSDQYEDLSPAEATVLGDLSKELFFETNPELVDRAEGSDGQVYFTVNAQGISELTKSNEARKRLFPTQNVRPSKSKLPKGQFVGEGQKLVGRFTKKAGKLGDISLIEEAMENLHEVPNVVDPRRARVLVSTALPAMLQAIQGKYDSAWSNTAGIGTKVLNKFEAAAKLDAKRTNRARDRAAKKGEEFNEPAPYNVRSNMDSQVDALAQSIRAVAIDRKGANYLTYAMQSFTGRVHPQQTYFDPTASKTVRFATRNATPAVARSGSRVEANLKQMYAMMMIKEASEALPQERLRLLEVHGPKMYEMGKTIEAALDEQIPPQLAEQIAQAIEQNVPLTDQRFPQVPELKLPENIRSYIEGKGDDALSVLEGLVDYKNFVDNMKAGKPHHTFFNAYMDGKTNGIANNGMQLGNEVAAFRTGVLRTQDKRLLDGDQDIRSELRNEVAQKLNEGIEGIEALSDPTPVYDFAHIIAQDSPLSKATSMQFGYGKELDSFKADIEEVIEEYAVSNPEEHTRALEAFDGQDTKLRDAIHAVYMTGLVNALSEDAAKARAIMRSNAVMYALTDQLFSIKGPSGFQINMGGNQILPDAEEITYRVSRGDQAKQRKALLYKSKPTSAAARGETPGLFAYGRSLPSPVQSIDAATVAKTVTGKSWEKLKQASNGNPYIHTIYDAFKVDANGYDVVLKDVNKNWFDTTMDWSYLEETAKAAKRDMEKFWKEFDALPNEINVKDHHGANMMQYLLAPSSKNPDTVSLTNKLTKTIFDPNVTDEQAGKAAKATTEFVLKTLIKMGYKPGSNTVTKEQYRWFVNFMEKNVYALHRKNAEIVDKTNGQKAKLRQKIASSGQKVYQYYSH